MRERPERGNALPLPLTTCLDTDQVNMAILPNIPPEVLGEIFYLTLRGPISNEQESLFPWSLGRVCKSWRHAFATYPALWAVCSVLGIIHLASFSAPVNMAVTNDCHGSRFGKRSYLARIVGKTSFYVEKRCNFAI